MPRQQLRGEAEAVDAVAELSWPMEPRMRAAVAAVAAEAVAEAGPRPVVPMMELVRLGS